MQPLPQRIGQLIAPDHRCRDQGLSLPDRPRAGQDLRRADPLLAAGVPVVFLLDMRQPSATAFTGSESFEIAAGLFDDDFGIRPDKHIFVDFMPPWDDLHAQLPAYTMEQIYALRKDFR